MIKTTEYQRFLEELNLLFLKYKVGTYLLSLMTKDPTDNLVSDMPTTFNVLGDPVNNVPAARMGAVFVQHLLTTQISILMRFCGLSLVQAVGALREGLNAAAAEMEANATERAARSSSEN